MVVPCGMRRSHRYIGKLGGRLESPAVRFEGVNRFLCWVGAVVVGGGTSWRPISFCLGNFLKAVGHSLSHICKIGLRPVVVNMSYIVE